MGVWSQPLQPTCHDGRPAKWLVQQRTYRKWGWSSAFNIIGPEERVGVLVVQRAAEDQPLRLIDQTGGVSGFQHRNGGVDTEPVTIESETGDLTRARRRDQRK